MKNRLERMQRANLIKIAPNGIARIRGPGFGVTRREFGVGLGAATALAAAGLPRPASAAAEVHYMGWQGYEVVFNADDFATKNDIVVNATFQNDNSHAIATATGGGIGQMDIISPDTAYTSFMKKIDMLEPLDLERIPNYQKLDPFFQNLEGVRIDGQQWSLPFVWTIIPLMYNPDHVNETPQSWHDMLKPEYKGKVGLTNDLISMMVCFSLAVTGKMDATRITKDELQEVLAFIIDLKKNHARTVASSYGELTDLFVTGEVWIAQGWVPVQLWAADKGGNVKWVIPKEGAHAPVDCLAMVKDAPEMEADYKLLNHAMSARAQAYCSNINATGVTNKDAVALLDPKILEIQPHDDIAGFYQKTTGGQPLALWPTEPDGDLATLDDILDAWDKFMAA